MLVARHYRLTGRVQGVGFRFFTERTARLEGLTGWVRNTEDGSVEVFAEGDAEAIARFEAKLRKGPPGARVDQVDTTIDTPSGRGREFAIQS
jgi:acylphosphatase